MSTKMTTAEAKEAIHVHAAEYPACGVLLTFGVAGTVEPTGDDEEPSAYETDKVFAGLACQCVHGEDDSDGSLEIKLTVDRANAAWSAQGGDEGAWDPINEGADQIAATLGCTVVGNDGGTGYDDEPGQWCVQDVYHLEVADAAVKQ